MKPPPFEYHCPRDLPAAIGLLSTLENAKLLAGGQSLMPMLNMRFVLPDHVIDLNRIDGLAYIREESGAIVIGGMTRRLLPVPAETAFDERLVGRWRDRLGVEIAIRSDGTASWPWAGTIGRETKLTPLPGGRALVDLAHGPWRHRPCLWLQPDGSLRLAGHRSRILHFHRIEGGQS